MTMRTIRSTETPPPPPDEGLPLPADLLREIGLTDEQIEQARAARPTVWADQAREADGAYFDVDRVKRVLRALAAFKHTKGRWAGLTLRLDSGGLAPWQVAWVIAPVFGWVRYDPEVDQVVRVI